jgi:hypothetical protein
VTGLEIRILVYGLLVLVLGGAGWYVKDRLQAGQEAGATVTSMTGTAKATEATTGAAGDALTQRQQLDIVLHQGRAAAVQATEDLSHADPTVAELRARPLPDGLRDIYRARREARDRPAGAPAGG